MPSESKKQTITSGEYEHLCEIGVAFEGIVELENGLLLYVYCETAVIGHFENKHHISYGTSTKSYEVPVCPQDNTRVNIQRQELPIEAKSSKYDIERKVRDELLSKLSDFSKGKSRRSVNERLTEEDKFYGSLHDKISNGTIKKKDFERGRYDQSLTHALRKEIDTYFACFDPVNPDYKAFWSIYESPFGCAEDWIPVWGQAKLAAESLNRGLNGYGAGYYFHAVGYVLLGVADLCSFGMESAIAKGLNTVSGKISGALQKIFSKGTVNPNKIHFMQSSIKNTTGAYTVMGNAEALANGTLDPNILKMNVWKDANGKIWTLDNRRLAAFRLSGLQNAPIQWADPASQMWKMTTTNGGVSIRLKFGDGSWIIVK